MTVPTTITIYQDAEDKQWRIEFHEDEPGTRHLEFGPYKTPADARAWIAEAVTVPLPATEDWTRTDVPGLRVEFTCTIQNEVPA